MLPVAYLNCLCTATISPYGPCVGIAYGRIIEASVQTYVDNLPVATVGDAIAYSGLVHPYSGGSPIYVSWIGRVLSSQSDTYVEGRQLATINTPTDASGFVIEGNYNIYG